ncbi:MAG: NAD(P)/FAD-dependent oxidoreductase [Burkholderiaceae bacterium]
MNLSPLTPQASVVIVGAGQAGAMAAAALRDGGFAGRIVLVGHEPHRPYERPPLSKAVLCEADEPRLDVLPDAAFDERGIEWLGGVAATGLAPERCELMLSDGRRLGYDRCLLATGGQARGLPALPPGTPNVHYLRSLDDARALRARLVPGVRVAVVGGGFLGLELASSARARGADVALLESAPRLLERFVPPEVSAWLAERARALGIALHLGASLSSSEARAGAADPIVLHTAAGARLAADLAIVAIGLTPSVELAQAAGLRLDPVNGGISVDAHGQTSCAGIYAAGDCASQFRDIAGATLRLESWQNANEQGRAAAAAMLGLPPPPPAYPWFWTDQLGCNVQMLGLPAADLNYQLRGDPLADPCKAIWLGHRDGVPVHGIAINAGGDLRVLRPLFEQRAAIDLSGFGDHERPLRGWVKALQAQPGAATSR